MRVEFAKRTGLKQGSYKSPTPDSHPRAIKSILCVVAGIVSLGIIVSWEKNDA